MRLEEVLQQGLDEIVDTFKDEVPKDFKGINVIRYSMPDSSSSLFGDDLPIRKTRHIQVDLYTNRKRFDLEERLEAFFKLNYFLVINEKETTEAGKKRKIYFLNFEE